jgi:ABC-2 type transport system permease protein
MTDLGPLLRQRARRDGVQLALWIVGTVALAGVGFPGVQNSYGDEPERVALLATVMANPVILLFRGLPSGAGETQMVVFLLLPWLLILAAMMSTFLAVRHTRGDEEDGRLELLSATPAARWTPTIATLIHGVVANIVLGALVTLAFLANGAATTGSVLVGASCPLVGILFLGVGLVAAQLMPTSRGANSLSMWIVLGTFVLAGIGNALGTPSDDLTRMQSSWLTWLSPFGWAENTRAFDEDAWGPLVLLAAVAAILVVGAFALQSRRDLGGAFVPERVGRADARPALRSNLALVTRLAMPSVIGWVIGGLLVGALATALGSVVSEMGGENTAVADVLDKLSGGGDLQTGAVVVFFIMLGILAACAGVQTVIRARQDEARGTAEVMLAAPIARVRWLGDYLVVALGAVVLTIAGGIAGAALGAAGAKDGGDLARDALIAGVGQLLPAAVFVGLTGLVFVLAPRLTVALGWTLLMLAAMIGLFGPLFGMDEQTAKISPFASALTPTPDGVDLGGFWWILVASIAFIALSLGLMRRRELTTGG